MIKKIAYFVGEFPSKSETWVYNEILGLTNEGYIVKIFSRNKKPKLLGNYNSLIIQNVQYRRLVLINLLCNPIKNLKDFFTVLFNIWPDLLNDTNGLRGKLQVLKDLIIYLSYSKKIRSFNPDLVIVHFANAKSNPAIFNHILYHTPYIIKMHAVDVYRRPNLFRLKVALAYKILIISNYNIEFLKNRDKDIDLSKFIVHHCGIVLENYEYKPKFRASNEIPIILSVGRLAQMKGHDTLIKASWYLHKRGIKHKLIIVGHGPEERSLLKLSKDLELFGSIDFKGFCPPDEVRKLLYLSDLFVLASKYDQNEIQDGIPVSLMEAMSVGLPVISTKISGIPELIEDNRTGFLVEPNDPTDLANKIEETINLSCEQILEITQNARSKIESQFNLKKLNIELINLFETIHS
jgi:glycosyltransferase involved in cell wall biosynthesis